MGTINAQCTLGPNTQPFTVQLTTPPNGKLSDTIDQMKTKLMEHMNESLAAQGASTADDIDVMEETVSDDDQPSKHNTKKNKKQRK